MCRWHSEKLGMKFQEWSFLWQEPLEMFSVCQYEGGTVLLQLIV